MAIPPWLVLGAVVAGPALGQTPGPPPVDIAMTVRPVRSGGSEVVAIAVRTEIRGSLDRTASTFSARAPITYAGVRHIADRVDSLVVRDATGVLALRVEDDRTNPAGFPYYRHWRGDRPVVPPVVMTYRMRPFVGVPIAGPQFDFYVHGGGISSGGMALFVVPENIANATSHVRWDLTDLSDGSIAASSYGEGDFDTTGPPEQLIQAYYMVGPLGRYTPPASSSSGFRAYWLGQPLFDAPREMAWAFRAYEYQKRFYQDTSASPYRVFVRAIPGAAGSLGGTALGRSFMVGTPAGAPDSTRTAARGTIAHEMGHMWVGGLAGGGVGGTTWFNEGLNVYYTRLLLLRSGLSPVADYERDVNSSARGYFSSPYRTVSADSIARLGFSTGIGAGSAQNLPYVRGSLYFADVDAKIRAASGGRRKLDDVMLPLFARRRNGEQIDRRSLVDALVKELGPSARDEFEAVIIRGELLEPASGAFGPCFERRPTTYTLNGRESSGFEWLRVTGVPDSECRKW
jgi:hypothetical protein